MNVLLGLYTKTKKSDNKKSVDIHVKNLHYRVTEIFIIKNAILQDIMTYFYFSRK